MMRVKNNLWAFTIVAFLNSALFCYPEGFDPEQSVDQNVERAQKQYQEAIDREIARQQDAYNARRGFQGSTPEQTEHTKLLMKPRLPMVNEFQLGAYQGKIKPVTEVNQRLLVGQDVTQSYQEAENNGTLKKFMRWLKNLVFAKTNKNLAQHYLTNELAMMQGDVNILCAAADLAYVKSVVNVDGTQSLNLDAYKNNMSLISASPMYTDVTLFLDDVKNVQKMLPKSSPEYVNLEDFIQKVKAQDTYGLFFGRNALNLD